MTITAPVAGSVIVQSTAGVSGSDPVICTLSPDSTRDGADNQIYGGGDRGMLAGQRLFPVTAGQTLTANLVCAAEAGTPAVLDSTMTALFFADSNVAVAALTVAGAPGADDELVD